MVSVLAKAVGRAEWISVHKIDLPLSQQCLFHAIDEVSYSALMASAPDLRSRALALSSAIQHAGD